jgi:hypothetical protein
MNPPMKTDRRIVTLTAIPTALAVFLTVAPFTSPAAHAQSLREAGKTAVQAKSGEIKAEESKKAYEAKEAEEEEDGELPDRSALGWTGIGLVSAGGAQLAMAALSVNRWRSCGPGTHPTCRSQERVYGISGGTLLATGLTFIVIDEARRHRERERLPQRRMAIALAPHAIQVRMLF